MVGVLKQGEQLNRAEHPESGQSGRSRAWAATYGISSSTLSTLRVMWWWQNVDKAVRGRGRAIAITGMQDGRR